MTFRLLFSINTYIQLVSNKPESQDLLDLVIIIFPPIAGFQVIDLSSFVDQPAELAVGHIPIVHRLNILGSQYLP